MSKFYQTSQGFKLQILEQVQKYKEQLFLLV
jgi:hypothetical protein